MLRGLALAVMAVAVAVSPASADKGGQGKGKSKGKDKDTVVVVDDGRRPVVVFADRDRDVVRGYWVETYGRGNCPPGLAKKNRLCLPPGAVQEALRGGTAAAEHGGRPAAAVGAGDAPGAGARQGTSTWRWTATS